MRFFHFDINDIRYTLQDNYDNDRYVMLFDDLGKMIFRSLYEGPRLNNERAEKYVKNVLKIIKKDKEK